MVSAANQSIVLEAQADLQPSSPSEASLPGAMVWFVWVFGSLCLVGGSIWLTILSRRFEWGVGHAERPILTVVLVMGVMGLGFLVSVGLSLWRRWRIPLWLLLGIALLSRGALLSSNLIQESDGYRYVLDGMATLNGVNPYRYSPDRIRFDARDQMGASLDTSAARLVIARVSYPELPTIYPPLAQSAFALGAALTPWDWRGQRWVFTGLDIGVIVLLLFALRRLGKPVAWAAVYAWNPLVLKEIANSAHLESLVALPIVGLTALLALHAARPSSRFAAAAGLCFAAAVLAKIFPLTLAPIALAVLARSPRPFHSILAFGGAAALTIAACVAIFLDVGWDRFTQSLGVYARTWEVNAGAYSVLSAMTSWGRTISLAVPALVALGLAWRVFVAAKDKRGDALIFATQGTLLAWFLFLPAAFPWYATSLLAVSAMRPRFWVFVLSIAFALYYVRFHILYHDLSQSWSYWVRAVEHGAVWSTLGLGWVLALRPWTGGSLPCESA
ncbi:MAG: hypothetical protein GC154_19420 [bacterium]|nr:hypothetical protein [bacterium]